MIYLLLWKKEKHQFLIWVCKNDSISILKSINRHSSQPINQPINRPWYRNYLDWQINLQICLSYFILHANSFANNIQELTHNWKPQTIKAPFIIDKTIYVKTESVFFVPSTYISQTDLLSIWCTHAHTTLPYSPIVLQNIKEHNHGYKLKIWIYRKWNPYPTFFVYILLLFLLLNYIVHICFLSRL